MHSRRLLALLVPLALLAAACGGDDEPAAGETASEGGGGERLTLYSGRAEDLVQPLIDRFEDETGITVEVRYGESAEMGAALLEEGEGTPADVFYSQEVGAVGVLDKAGLLAPLPEEVVQKVGERFRPHEGTDWVGVTGRSRVIVYNPDLVAEPPSSVLDLTDPAYEGMTGWAPSNASFQGFVTAFRVSQGEDAAHQWLEGMQDNGVKTYANNVEILEAVENGDLAMGLINHYYWARAVAETGDEGTTAQLVFLQGDDPGALVNATAVAIMAGSADDPAALELVEYLLSEGGQTYFAEETFEYPLVEGVHDPEGVPPLEALQGPQLDLTDLDSLEQTQALLADLGILS